MSIVQTLFNENTPLPGGMRYCLLYTSDAADDLLCVDLGGRRIIKKKDNRLMDFNHYLIPPEGVFSLN